jgi:hypothetical protein
MATRLTDLDPGSAAAAIIERTADEWLDAFVAALDRHRAGDGLRHILEVWGVSQAEFARLRGVSRQAVGNWLSDGPPSSRLPEVGDLAAATDLLEHYLRRDRIPAVVRRPAEALSGSSLLDLVAAGRHEDVLAACSAMFDFHGVSG